MRKIQRSGSILIFLMVLGFSIAGHAQTRVPDVHFDPTPWDVVEAMLNKAGVNQDDVVYDLGCGDGRFVILAAKNFGARGVGVDIDPVRIKESKENAQKAKVADRTTFIEGDLFKADIREATVVTLYLLNDLNYQLRQKLFRELKPGTRIVSYTFDMADWEPDEMMQIRDRFFYYWVIPADVKGIWRFNIASLGGDLQDQLTLNQKYQEVSGKIIVQGREFHIRDQRLKGNQVSFGIRYNVEGQNVLMKFSGRVTGDLLEGSVEVQGGPWAGTKPWNAQRVKH
ncbi:MAG: methyltransferase domain-containing protein [Deltaproteobacteria bacterium]|nr:methyltransferase domain-containing protein [Deltaproteobacteria bacterium]